MNFKKVISLIIILLSLLAIFGQEPLHAQKPLAASDDLLLATMEKELHRGQFELAKQDPAPYFTSYNVTDGESLVVLSAQGGILTSTHARHRAADVSMRIGTPALDNTFISTQFTPAFVIDDRSVHLIPRLFITFSSAQFTPTSLI